MKLVIDIPEELLNKCIFGGAPTMSPVDKARCIIKIAHGKRLPEGHGRLIDADMFLARNAYFADKDFIDSKYGDTLKDLIDNAPTIIEADKEVSE